MSEPSEQAMNIARSIAGVENWRDAAITIDAALRRERIRVREECAKAAEDFHSKCMHGRNCSINANARLVAELIRECIEVEPENPT